MSRESYEKVQALLTKTANELIRANARIRELESLARIALAENLGWKYVGTYAAGPRGRKPMGECVGDPAIDYTELPPLEKLLKKS